MSCVRLIRRNSFFKESEAFCSNCGSPLVFVCKDCYTQLPDDIEKYCVRCRAKHGDRKDKTKKILTGVGAGVGGIGGSFLVAKFGKKVLDVVIKKALDVVENN